MGNSVVDYTVSFTINTINYEKNTDTFLIEGTTPKKQKRHTKLVPYFNDSEVRHEITTASEESNEGFRYRFKIPAKKEGILSMGVVSRKGATAVSIATLTYTRISHIGRGQAGDYRIIRNTIIAVRGNTLVFMKRTPIRLFWYELNFFTKSLRDKEIPRNLTKTMLIETLRIAALLRPSRNRPKVWLFSDRAISGGDNSEVLFRYASAQKDRRIKPVFVVNSRTHTYRDLKRRGYNVVKFRSVRHLYLAIVADLLIPSHLDVGYMFPWVGVWHKYSGLIKYKIVHTQHGIVLNDMPDYIGKYKKNAQLFLSVCDWERANLIEKQYGYGPEEVVVTGAPRYDELIKGGEKKIISLHPTWRSALIPNHQAAGHPGYTKAFKDSEYYNYYQSLLNDPNIANTLDKNGYILKFYLHPNHSANLPDFNTKFKNIEIMTPPYDYNAMLSESSILVTDYSNIMFDFAYLRKPIILTQFDAGSFFPQQSMIKKQRFQYDKDGFGPICSDYESAVSKINDAIKHGPVMSKIYRDRIDKFFTYHDRRNCERAYNAIKQLS